MRLFPTRLILPIVSASALLLAAPPTTNEPTNSQPNPYKVTDHWGTMPGGRTWGSAAGVSIDKNGTSVWVAERCGANSCADKPDVDPIIEFDEHGNFVKSFGKGMFVFPHGLYVDKDDNIWVTDGQGKDGKGHQVFKFSPDGKVLLTLGKAGVAGKGNDEFNEPSAVIVGKNGDIFVADGHGPNTNMRIVKFDKNGKFIKTWGHKGTAQGEFDVPHCLAFDAKNRLFVCDRNNNRIQVFDQDGNFIEQYTQYSRPSGIAIDKHGMIYVVDSESNSVSKNHPGWKRGLRVGNLKEGSVLYFVPDPNEEAKGTSAAEGVAVDAHGVIYGAEVGPKDIKKYVKE